MDSIGMQRLKAMFDDDSAVSPVIGVILMVAITVILAAVIASFVLGLGQGNDPAPNPTISSSVDSQNDNITLDVTGGDDFDTGVATLQGEVDGTSFETDLDNVIDSDQVTAGDSIVIDAENGTVSADSSTSVSLSNNAVSNGWEVEIVWNPSDQDSTVIYSDSS
jgi:flagellin-like protein